MKTRRAFLDFLKYTFRDNTDTAFAFLHAHCGVSARTWRLWLKNDAAPVWAWMLLEVANGALTYSHPDWSKWAISARGELCSPFNEIFTPGRIMAAYWTAELKNDLTRKVKKLEAELATLRKAEPVAPSVSRFGPGVRGRKRGA